MTSLKTKNELALNSIDYDVLKNARKTARITLPNGLKLIIYPKKHPETHKLFERCNKAEMQRWLDPPMGEGYWHNYCMIKIHANHVEVRVLILVSAGIDQWIKAQIREKGLGKMVSQIIYLEYKGVLYHWASEEGKQLIEAINNGVGLEVYQLLRDQQTKTERS